MSRAKGEYPRARPYKDARGKRRWRFRKQGFTRELGTQYGTPEFERRYHEAVQEAETGRKGVGVSRTRPKSFNDLIAKWYEIYVPTVDQVTVKTVRSVLEPFRERHGDKLVAHLKASHVLKLKAEFSDKQPTGNKFLKALRRILDHAIVLGWRTDNPAKAIKNYQIETGGFHTWTEDEISRYLSVHKADTIAFKAMQLILYTGASRVDVVKLGWHNIKDGRIVYRRNKTRKNPNGIEVNINIHPELEAVINTFPRDQWTFLQTWQGKQRSPNGFGNSMRDWCDQAKLPQCSAHGLRKAICRRLADAGCTATQIMSVSGHISLAEAQRYVEEFGRKQAADVAIARLQQGAHGEQTVTNTPIMFVRSSTNLLKDKGKK